MTNSNNTYKNFDIVNFSQLYNWSVQYQNDSKIRFTTKYPLVRIKEFLTRNKTAISIQNDVYYKRATIKVRNGGISLRDSEIGNKIGTKNQFLISKGQFLLSKIDARNGAFGVVPDELDGGVITGNFWTYDVDYSKVNPHYLALLTTTSEFIAFCEQASNGTTNRHYLQEPLFLDIKVPLPSLDDQDKLVADYNSIINEAHSRFSEGLIKAKEARAYLSKCLGVEELHPNGSCGDITTFELVPYNQIREWDIDNILNKSIYVSSKYETVSLSDDCTLYEDAKRGKSPRYDKESNKIILNQKCIRWGKIDIQYAKTVDPTWLNSIEKEDLTHEGDILINSTGEGTIGRSAVVDNEHAGLLYDSHVLLLRLNKERIIPQYFEYVFNSSYVQEQIAKVKSARTTKQTELGVENLKRILLPVPPLNVQKKIVERLTAMYKEVNELQQLSPYYKKAISSFENQIFEEK